MDASKLKIVLPNTDRVGVRLLTDKLKTQDLKDFQANNEVNYSKITQTHTNSEI